MSRTLFRDPHDPFQSHQLRLGCRSVLDYGEIDLHGTKDCTRILNLAFSDAAQTPDLEIVLPSGTYKTTEPLMWRDSSPRIRGAGVRTVIRPDDRDYDWLVCGSGPYQGTGAQNSGIIGPAGWLRDFRLRGMNESNPGRGNFAGIKLTNCLFTEMKNLWVHFQHIGFDMIYNNFGTAMYTCRTFSSECNIGLLLRGLHPDFNNDFGAGNDLSFYNCWFHGGETALWIEGQNGNYHFHGGQLNGGSRPGNIQDDNRGGCITAGANYNDWVESGGVTYTPMGSCGLTFIGTTFERAANGWSVRYHGVGANPNGAKMTFMQVSFWASDQENTSGVMKLTGGYNDQISFINCGLAGPYTGPVPISVTNAPDASNPRPCWFEVGSHGSPSFNGVVTNIQDTGMMRRSSVLRATAISGSSILLNGAILRYDHAIGRWTTSATMVNPVFTPLVGNTVSGTFSSVTVVNGIVTAGTP